MSILALLNEDSASISVQETVRATKLPKTTVLRLLQTLDESGLLWGTGGRYQPGPTLLRLSRIAEDAWTLPPKTNSLMKALAEESGETVHFYLRKYTKRVCIAQVQGPQGLRHVIRVGDELPLWGGASAKILLTAAPSDILREVAKLSPNGDFHIKTMEGWIAEANENGWASSHAEREEGVSAVAVPVTLPHTRELLALSVSGPSSRFTELKTANFIDILKSAAKEIQRLGHDESPTS